MNPSAHPSFRKFALVPLAALALVPALSAQQGELADQLAAKAIAPAGLFRTADGSLEADGSRYRARFDGDGARMTSLDTPSAELALRLTDWGRRGACHTAASASADRTGRELVQYSRAGIVEHYAVSATGFEQSFVLAQQPPGDGDLVIGIEATSATLQAAACSAAHQSLEFRDSGDAAIRYGEAYVFERGGERVPVATRYDGDGRIELIVPAAFLESANYPITVDPVVGPLLLPGGTSTNDSQPDVAYDPETGHYMVVWTRTFFNGATDLRAKVYDEEGGLVAGTLALTSDGVSRNPSIAAEHMWGANGFLVAYESGDRIRCGQFRAATGLPGLAAIDVSDPGPGEVDRRPSVSAMSGAFWKSQIIWDRTAAGASEPNRIVTRTVYASTPSNVLATLPEVDIETVFSGYVRNARFSQVAVPELEPNAFKSNYRAVWERFYTSPAPGDSDIRTATMRSNHSSFVLTSGPTTLSGAGEIGPNERLPAIAVHKTQFYAGFEQFLIAWDVDGDIRAGRYDRNGPIGPVFDVRATTDVETAPTVAAGSCEFTVGYLQAIPPNEFAFNVRAARVMLDGTVVTNDRAVDVLNGPFQEHLRSASRPTTYFAEAQRNTTMFAWRGDTGTGGTGLSDVRARLFEPVAPLISPFGVACPGPLGELPAIGTTGGNAVGGNPSFAFTIDDAPANSLAVLVVSDVFSTTPIPGAPGCTLYAGLPLLSLLPTVTDAVGGGAVGMEFPCQIPPGASLAFQWAVMTPGWNPFGWIVSNDLDIYWNQ